MQCLRINSFKHSRALPSIKSTNMLINEMMDLLGWYPKGSRYTLLCLTGAGGQFFDLVEARIVENCLFLFNEEQSLPE